MDEDADQTETKTEVTHEAEDELSDEELVQVAGGEEISFHFGTYKPQY